jgi:hypothetical protein
MAETPEPPASGTEDILDKANALLARHRSAVPAGGGEPPVDFPVLTEILHEATAAGYTEAQLESLERDLRLELLGLLGPEFERLVEANVHERIGAKVEEVMGLARKVLEAEVRAAVRDALGEVIAAETARLRAGK